MKPIDRFGMDLQRIRFLDPMTANDELFYVEDTRAVRKDNTFSVGNVRYEAPRDLAGRSIEVRFDRAKPDRIVVFYKGERMGEATRLDFLANDRAPSAASRPPRPTEEAPPSDRQ
jgi:putative transposase